MRRLLVLGMCALSRPALAQVNLPPPPPPPLSTNSPAQPPPPAPSPHPRPSPAPAAPAPAPASRSRPAQQERGQPHEREARAETSYAGARPWSLRFNPLPLFSGRASVDAEYTFAPHHAVVLSPNVTFAVDRQTATAIGFGNTAPNSSGLGAEVGYHYWFEPTAEGLFLGPALLLGLTSYPGFGSRLNYGLAFDVGYQVIVGAGFTVMAGGGLLVIDQTGVGNVVHVLPRALLGLGWSF